MLYINRYSAIGVLFVGLGGLVSSAAQAQTSVPAGQSAAANPAPRGERGPAPAVSAQSADRVAAKSNIPGQTPPAGEAHKGKASQHAEKPTEHWYERIKFRGYTQIRYNQLFATNDRLINTQGDKSMGGGNSFFIRRARLILYGDVHPQVYVYLQPDFATVISESTHTVSLRDWYADVALDKKREFRFRVGQSKVPYGFENMQSSQNRLPLDRSDALNSAVANERDLGVFFYYAPEEIRKRFKHLVDSGLKGSGDYGMLAFGMYNGQTANNPERNDNRHLIARFAYPFLIGKQYVELGFGGYTGKYFVKKDKDIRGNENVLDVRAHATFVLYPQPFGLQIEYNVGRGPELVGNEIRERPLHGGYALASLKLGDFIPYVRAVYYEGGKKHEKNAPRYRVNELEFGVEWQAFKALELTAAYMIASRTNASESPYTQEEGQLARVQLQFNY